MGGGDQEVSVCGGPGRGGAQVQLYARGRGGNVYNVIIKFLNVILVIHLWQDSDVMLDEYGLPIPTQQSKKVIHELNILEAFVV